MTTQPGPYCFAYNPNLPSFMFGPPTSPDAGHADLDALAALEAKAWSDYYRLGRRNLAQLCRYPLAELDDECRPIEQPGQEPPAAIVRVFLLLRRFQKQPGRNRADAATFAKQGPPVGALWLHLTRDNLAGPQSFGSVQIVRLSVAAKADAAAIVASCVTFAQAVPPSFLPPAWPGPEGRRPVTLYLPTEDQPIKLAGHFEEAGFTQAGYAPDAFGDRRPGRLYVLPNGLEQIANSGEPRP